MTTKGDAIHTTTDTPTRENSYEMVQMWVWFLGAAAAIVILFKFCSWCAEQNRNSRSTPTRSLSRVAIIDAAVPQSMTCPHCNPLEHLALDQPPPYGSLPPGYHEDPPPSYSSVVLQAQLAEEHGPPSAVTEDSSRSLHM